MTARSAVDREVGQGRGAVGGAGQGVAAGGVGVGMAEAVGDQHDVAAGAGQGGGEGVTQVESPDSTSTPYCASWGHLFGSPYFAPGDIFGSIGPC